MSSVVLVEPAGQAAHPVPAGPAPATGVAVPFWSFGEEGGPLDIGDPDAGLDDADADGSAVPAACAGPAGDPDAHPVSTSPVSSAPAAAAVYSFTPPSSRAGPAMTFLSYQSPRVGRPSVTSGSLLLPFRTQPGRGDAVTLRTVSPTSGG